MCVNICQYLIFQAESVRNAAWACDWVGTPVPFQRCLVFIIVTANKEFTLTAGKFVPVCNKTMMNVRLLTVHQIKKLNNANYIRVYRYNIYCSKTPIIYSIRCPQLDYQNTYSSQC